MLNIQISDIKITPPILAQIAEIDGFKASWTGFTELRPEQLSAMRRVSTIESIGSSNRIEGNTLSDTEIGALLSQLDTTSFNSRDEEEVAGYAELMNLIFDDYAVIPFSENYIKQLHHILLKYVGKDERHRGEYKKLANSVAAFDPDGKEIGIVFDTASPFDTPRLMEELVAWTRKNLADPLPHPLIVIGIFIVYFLAIHPFQDGNGRLSRAITAMLLLQSGYTYVPYSSIEAIIEGSKSRYYDALRQTQKNMTFSGEEANVDYEPWLSFFLTTLQKQKRHLEEKITHCVESDTAKLSRTARLILDLFNETPEWVSNDITARLALNAETTKKNLKLLVNGGYITKHGTTKGAWYKAVKKIVP